MMHKYIGSDVTSMVTLPVIIFEPMTMLQRMAEVCAIEIKNVHTKFSVYIFENVFLNHIIPSKVLKIVCKIHQAMQKTRSITF